MKRTILRQIDGPSLVVVVGIVLVAVVLNRHHAYPLDDEIAFVPATIDAHWTTWLSQGFLDYFLTYGGWSDRFTPFIRPIDNLAYRLVHDVCAGLSFRTGFAVYLSVYGAAVFAGAELLRRTLADLGVPDRPARAAGRLYLLNPAVIGGVGLVPQQFDMLAGMFAVAAFRALWRGRTAAPLACLLLGVFTKEIVLTAPLAAALCCWRLERRPAKAALMLVPLVLWTAAYVAAFGATSLVRTGTGSAALARLPLMPARGLALWPLGIGDSAFLHDLAAGTASIAGDGPLQAAIVAANLVLWLVLAAVAWPLVRRPAVPLGAAERGLAYAAIWLAAALGMGVIAAQGSARYGGWTYPALLIAGAAWWNAPSLWNRWRGLMMRAAAGLLAAAFAVYDWRTDPDLEPDPVEAKLHDALLALGDTPRVVLVVGGPTWVYANPRLVREAWRLPFEVRQVSRFDGCPTGDGGATSIRDGVLHVTVPDCAWMDFAGVADATLLAAIAGSVHRDGVGAYHFAAGRILGRALRDPSRPIVDVGRSLTVALDPAAAAATILAYDWEDGTYRILAEGGALR